MRKILFSTILFLIISSCCTKKACLSTGLDQDEVDLLNFTLAETNSLVVSSFLAGSNFTNPIDSAFSEDFNISEMNSRINVSLSIDLNAENDYRFEFRDLGLTYNITNIELGEYRCNKCFLKKDNNLEFTNYQVNGTSQQGAKFELSK